jgi:hypothetical protein
LRFHTRGYSGAKNQNQRESSFYSEEEAKSMKKTIQGVMLDLKDIESLPAFKFTHFMRGELFVYIDMILTSNFHLKEENNAMITKEEMEDILEICKLYCNLYHHWLLSLPNTFKAVHLF